MKKLYKLNLIAASAGLLTVGLAGSALAAFHLGGVANCGGCHSMHSPSTANMYLLHGGDQSSTCLNCHQQGTTGDFAVYNGASGYYISGNGSDTTVPTQFSPGGDFSWTKRGYAWTNEDGVATTETGASHGHNIIAADYSYGVDPDNAVSPTAGINAGFPADKLACNSCHDPHGKYRRFADGSIDTAGAPIIASGSYASSPVPTGDAFLPDATAVGAYRLLAGQGYDSVSYKAAGGQDYAGVPMAVAPDTYNRQETAAQTRVAYGANATGAPGGVTTWSNWCATCHGGMHSDVNAGLTHPVDQPLNGSTLGDLSAIYNAYINTSNTIGGDSTTSYLSLTPFAQNAGAFADLAANAQFDDSALAGPIGDDQVMCLSCHRAHASGFKNMLRWNNESALITVANGYPVAGTDNPDFVRGRTADDWTAAYYGRDAAVFGDYQRSLCNKCHAKD